MDLITYDKFVRNGLREFFLWGFENGLFSLTKPVNVNMVAQHCAIRYKAV